MQSCDIFTADNDEYYASLCRTLAKLDPMPLISDLFWLAAKMRALADALPTQAEALAPFVHSWVIEGDRRWLVRCDVCKRRHLAARYFEIYTDCKEHGSCWCYSCGQCLIEIITEKAERLLWGKDKPQYADRS